MTSIDRTAFYAAVRPSAVLFKGALVQSQIDGIEGLLSNWESDHAGQDLRWLAYALATTFHETARTFRPIEEYGKGKGRPYGKPAPNGLIYYGRGFVQLTWNYNYEKLGDRIGVDLLAHPERALDLDVATKVLFVGMIEGLFSGKRLADYLNAKGGDWVGARRIINGQDKAQDIAGYARAFLVGLAPGS